MEALRVVPKIFYFDTFKEFNEEFKIGKNDLVITNEFIYEPYMKPLGIDTNLIFQEKFGTGEPSDEMIDSMTKEMKKYNFDRIIAFGGGTIVDICKILALDVPEKSIDLFEGEVSPKKVKELVVVPTTCGTGSEVTNVAIAELKSKHTKGACSRRNICRLCSVNSRDSKRVTLQILCYKFGRCSYTCY